MLQTLASSWTACTADPVELPWRRWIHAWTLCPSPCPPHSNRRSALWRHPCVSWTPSQLWLSEPCEEKQMFKTQKLIISMFNIWNMYYEVSVNLLVNLTNIVGSFNFIRLCVVWIIDNKLDIQNTMGETLEQLTNRFIWVIRVGTQHYTRQSMRGHWWGTVSLNTFMAFLCSIRWFSSFSRVSISSSTNKEYLSRRILSSSCKPWMQSMPMSHKKSPLDLMLLRWQLTAWTWPHSNNLLLLYNYPHIEEKLLL